MSDKPPKDVSTEFTAQMKRFRPWAITIVVLVVAFLSSPLLMIALGIDLHYFLYASVVMVVILIPLVVLVIRASTCPACHRYMGRDIGKHCPNCGAILRKD